MMKPQIILTRLDSNDALITVKVGASKMGEGTLPWVMLDNLRGGATPAVRIVMDENGITAVQDPDPNAPVVEDEPGA